MAPILAKPEHNPTQLVLKNDKISKINPYYIVRTSHYTSYLQIKINKIIAMIALWKDFL